MGSLSAHARPMYRPETSQPRLGEKSHLLGASPCSSTPQGGPLYGWKKRVIFAAVGRARAVCVFSCTYVRCSHKGPRCLSHVEAEGCLLLDDSVLQVEWTAWALPGRQRAPGL